MHLPKDKLPEFYHRKDGVWYAMKDETYSEMGLATRRAERFRKEGKRVLVLRGMKGKMECCALYVRREEYVPHGVS